MTCDLCLRAAACASGCCASELNTPLDSSKILSHAEGTQQVNGHCTTYMYGLHAGYHVIAVEMSGMCV